MPPERPRRPEPPDPDCEKLATTLALVLTLLGGGVAILYLGFITFNYFFVLVLVALAVVGFGWLHWLLWGRFEPPKE